MATTTEETTLELSHKTKTIHFLGRTTPIILQNDNGPCPLLAICNVLLLKNNLNLSPDIPEVLQEKLLSLIAERLIDSNSNIDNKDAGFVENQQQNIADAIDLLPQLATGIDVNIKFTRINDFEFTRECAIFDLLDIPLYHGWIVDPQDLDTANAIGKKSYNTLMGDLVALETIHMESEQRKITKVGSVDFVAATTAVLGIPSPSLSRAKSFDELAPSDYDIARNRGQEEKAELQQSLKLAENNGPILANDEHTEPELVVKELVYICNKVENQATTNGLIILEGTPKEAIILKAEQVNDLVKSTSQERCENANVGDLEEEAKLLQDLKLSENNGPILVNDSSAVTSNSNEHAEPELLVKEQVDICNKVENQTTSNEVITLEVTPNEAINLKAEQAYDFVKLTSYEECEKVNHGVVGTGVDVLVLNENVPSGTESDSSCGKKFPTFIPDILEPKPVEHEFEAAAFSCLAKTDAELDSSERRQDENVSKVIVDDSEPIYEGEECILESVTKVYQDREPMYEGEVILAKQGDMNIEASCKTSLKEQISTKQGELINNFLKNSASQLTIYGLFCLQDGLKERELCVFFRNNHFNTMFKFEGELYILATDQGYLNQPDLVWEKLNEVNGNTVFMTSNFKEFKVESHDNSSWDEGKAVANTTDYIASMDNSANSNSSFNADLQLAMALQQQEFEHQQSQRNVQQQPVTTSSRLVTGPQVPRQSRRNPELSPRQDSKSSKDKCNIM